MLRSGGAVFAIALAAWAGDWGPAAEVRHDEEVAVSYQARLEGGFLLVRAKLAPGWHTFAMDNQRRAAEKLAGKPALSVDRATEIRSSGGLEVAGPWYQTPPKDFSRPELRWFSWGFEREAVFAVKARGSSGKLAVRGQACTDSICKNIDIAVTVTSTGKGGAAVNLKDLEAVR
jgi:hypothetical protein